MARFILTTVGTSTLTNGASASEPEALNRFANQRGEALTRDQQDLLAARRRAADDALERGPAAARQQSAELSALLRFYANQESQIADDIHYLVATDTAQGGAAAEVLAAYLRRRGAETVEVWQPRGFSTADPRSFARGCRELLKLCDETLPGYRASGVRVVFNTLGGFKGQVALLTVAGMFYADEILYVFESKDAPLLRIPRLPVRIDQQLFAEHAAEVLLLEAGQPAGGARPLPVGFPETLFDEPDADGSRLLSSWGSLLWAQVKDDLLAERPLPLPRIRYAPSFLADFDRLPRGGLRIRTRVQEAVADVAVELDAAAGSTQGLSARSGLRYERYSGNSGRHRDLAHFRVTNEQGGYRVSCEPWPEGGGLTLRRVGKHEAVNDDP